MTAVEHFSCAYHVDTSYGMADIESLDEKNIRDTPLLAIAPTIAEVGCLFDISASSLSTYLGCMAKQIVYRTVERIRDTN